MKYETYDVALKLYNAEVQRLDEVARHEGRNHAVIA